MKSQLQVYKETCPDGNCMREDRVHVFRCVVEVYRGQSSNWLNVWKSKCCFFLLENIYSQNLD